MTIQHQDPPARCECVECRLGGAILEINKLKRQLPPSMQHCTIVFKECSRGHGRLIATNWIDHGCNVCALRDIEARLKKAFE